ncbi:M20/M25/M40 family metallo-hydrolase [Brevibacterium sp. p3-SID960]|uniref:M20/M25/M40 family metallo-hydrolase n=1 Tax=Brevibacterium sp. p3-SID960 TaxID=2916063 RepID=UPI0021A47ABA|nr:M20/M25/M40 family metallo-hydrolase [Brevibacterium sp. p3-SID960]MCT1690431.1 M20/M25/M40 family metallo-hydrolase [Brevibacterium sp. p3-SID960]
MSHQFASAEAEVTRLCQELIRIDTQNWGNNRCNPERPAADQIAAWFAEVGLESQIYESAPGRATLVTRVPGTDPEAPALVVHGHTDVVPADAAEWSVDPFAGEIRDGLVWGRGAVDMKDMDAMIVAVVRTMMRENLRPRRDLIIVFFADEEAGGLYGSQWMAKNHPEVFDGATEAISEVGGYSVDIRGQRVYLVQTAEKGIAWLKLIARGTAGHGSQINRDNPVTKLAEAVARIGAYEWPEQMPQATRDLLVGVSELTGIPFSAETYGELLDELGSVAKFVGATFANTSNPSMLEAGYKHNVIPSTASAYIDCRHLPGQYEDLRLKLKELAGEGVDIEEEIVATALESPFGGRLVDTMVASLQEEDPDATVLPYTLSGGTDNKALSLLGITGYGFAPLRLTPDLDFPAMFHGVDERVPVSALEFGARVLGRFLMEA